MCWFVVILYQQITQIYAGFISFFPTGDQENYVFGQCCERAEGVAALCGEGGPDWQQPGAVIKETELGVLML